MHNKPLVYISRKLLPEWFAALNKHCVVKMHARREPPARAEFLRAVREAAGLIPTLTEKIDAAVFRAAPHLKVVANYAVGFDNIDLAAAKKYGIPVSNTPGECAGAVAEQAMALMQALTRRVVEGDKFIRAGQYRFWDPLLFLGRELSGQTLGIVGVGRIGAHLAKIARNGFDMKIIYHDAIRNEQIEKNFGAKKVTLAELLRQSDYVSLHVPLLPSTRHLIGEKELALMKSSAYLINTARGPVVDEKALVRALRAKKIAGAALDVFEFEPKPASGLSSQPNVVLTPHTASATYRAREEMARMAADNALDVLARGRRPRNEVAI